ncbi:MAG: oxygen-independent coproporphyrinogen III oxidase [Planctomycetota bacterium]|nr:oxygen-independent coproporphyrinogen III oxidase [Planctomycetota bacterium]
MSSIPPSSDPLTEAEIPTELLARYDRPGPRYTSYPTAPHMDPSYGDSRWKADLDTACEEHPDSPTSIYVHIPFCESLCYFCGCHTIISTRRERATPYLDRIEKELRILRPWLDRRGPVIQVHLGGGTPSYLNRDEIERLSQVLSTLNISPEAECSVEIDPRDLDTERLQAFAQGGFRRISMGVQDLDATVQKTVNRIQPEIMTRDTIQSARELGFRSVNLDLIYGLPHQTPESFAKTLQTILDLAPDRIALFNYAHVPWLKKHQKLLDPAQMPSASDKLSIFLQSIQTLGRSGYQYIGMDHFARSDDELAKAQREGRLWRNFQGYTICKTDLYGLGTSSISMLDGSYCQNAKSLTEYYDSIDRGSLPIVRGIKLNQDDRIRRHCIMSLMCNFRLDQKDLEKHFPEQNTSRLFESAHQSLQEMSQDGLVLLQPQSIEVLPVGRLLIRNICMAFDAYLSGDETENPRYSRTV